MGVRGRGPQENEEAQAENDENDENLSYRTFTSIFPRSAVAWKAGLYIASA